MLLFMTLPFLTAMYNGPGFYESHYKSFDYEYVSHEQVEDKYVYTLKIKNSSGYYYLYNLKLEGKIDDINYSLHLDSHGFSDVFADYMIGPYAEKTIKMVSSKEIPDINELTKDGSAITLKDDSVYKWYNEPSVIESIVEKPIEGDNPNNLFAYQINYKENAEPDYFYGGLIGLTYGDEDFYLLVEKNSSGSNIYTYEAIDLTQLTVKQVTLIEGYRTRINEQGIIAFLFMFLGIMVLISGGVFCIIFFGIYFVKRLTRKKKQQAAEE